MIHLNKILCFVFLVTLLTQNLKSQTVILEVDAEEERKEIKVKEKTKHHDHTYAGLDFITGPMEDGAEIRQPGSLSFFTGYRYNINYTKTLGIGSDFSFHFHNYKLRQKDNKIVPDTLINDKEKLMTTTFRLGIYKRIVFMERDRKVGNFIDIGGAAELNLLNFHITKNKGTSDMNFERIKTRKSGLDYNNPYNLHAYLRLGFNRFVIQASYRITDIFDESFDYPELPRVYAGFQLGLH